MKDLSMAVVVRSGRVLVQERFRKSKGFLLEFPGGAVNLNESAEDAAVRELLEETGMVCGKILGMHAVENEFGGNIHFVVMNAKTGSEAQTVNPARQQTFYWFKPREIPRHDFHSADINFIDNFLEIYTL